MGLMSTFDSLSPEHQEIARDMANAARDAMKAAGYAPHNDDRAARFDEACAVYLAERLREDTKAGQGAG